MLFVGKKILLVDDEPLILKGLKYTLEQEELLRRYRRNKAEFIAVYGRRRIGKTTLMSFT